MKKSVVLFGLVFLVLSFSAFFVSSECPEGMVEETVYGDYKNMGEDDYGPWIAVSYSEPYTTDWDTCDASKSLIYTCPADAEFYGCSDFHETDVHIDGRADFASREVTCHAVKEKLGTTCVPPSNRNHSAEKVFIQNSSSGINTLGGIFNYDENSALSQEENNIYSYRENFLNNLEGHTPSEIWVSVYDGEMTLLEALKSLHGLSPNNSFDGGYHFFPSDSSKPFHFATEIIYNATTGVISLQDLIQSDFYKPTCTPGDTKSVLVEGDNPCVTYASVDVICQEDKTWSTPELKIASNKSRGTSCTIFSDEDWWACDGKGNCKGYSGDGLVDWYILFGEAIDGGNSDSYYLLNNGWIGRSQLDINDNINVKPFNNSQPMYKNSWCNGGNWVFGLCACFPWDECSVAYENVHWQIRPAAEGSSSGGGWCGDTTCDGSIGETCNTCPADCGSCISEEDGCGDGTCDGSIGESCATCPGDCVCPDGMSCFGFGDSATCGVDPDVGGDCPVSTTPCGYEAYNDLGVFCGWGTYCVPGKSCNTSMHGYDGCVYTELTLPIGNTDCSEDYIWDSDLEKCVYYEVVNDEQTGCYCTVTDMYEYWSSNCSCAMID